MTFTREQAAASRTLSEATVRRSPRLHVGRLLRVLVVAAVVTFCLVAHTFWEPDTLLVLLVVCGAVLGLTRQMLLRFVPFLGLLIVFDEMRGWADKVNTTVHYLPQLDGDRWLFGGTVPTVWLQEHLWHGHVSWYDVMFLGLYLLHFLLPVVVSLVLWRWRPSFFWPFVWAIVGTTLAGVLTYALYPAAPPWMAAQRNLLGGPFVRISGEVAKAMGVQNFSALDASVSPNDVAAVPSLHAAFPLIAFVFLVLAFGWRRLGWIAVYPLTMWVGVVYMGEHYVVDVLLGIGYALVGCWVSLRLCRLDRARFRNGVPAAFRRLNALQQHRRRSPTSA
ncbi:MAG TPA: phosphatase PAP2 family protein [Propionibacteriaceae bacterium]|nr:phosphatase PAP2 family protein [Propionibacteriaceae bacterium]